MIIALRQAGDNHAPNTSHTNDKDGKSAAVRGIVFKLHPMPRM